MFGPTLNTSSVKVVMEAINGESNFYRINRFLKVEKDPRQSVTRERILILVVMTDSGVTSCVVCLLATVVGVILKGRK